MTLSFSNQIVKKVLTYCLALLFGSFLYAQSDLLEQQILVPRYKGTVEQLLDQISKEQNIVFAYSSEVSLDFEVHFSKRRMLLKDFLTELFSGKAIAFKANGNKILIYPNRVLSYQPGGLTQTVKGQVVDQESKFPLPGVNIVVTDLAETKGCITDENGFFHLEGVPVGRRTIQASYIGYKLRTYPEIVIGSAKEVVLNIEMEETPYTLNEAIIEYKKDKGVPNNEMATVSSRSFTLEESKRYPASINDPGRMALSFPGVSVGDDASNEIIIRGNNPSGLLWRIEGVEVPSPNHFYEEGMSAGYVSILSANLLTRSDFFTGAFPAEYGNAQSGVFDIALRNGNNHKPEYSFQFGVMGTDLAAEGPFRSGYNGSYLVNYRYSTLALLKQMGFEVKDAMAPEYQDLSFKLNLPTNRFGQFSIWGLGGISDATTHALTDSSKWESWTDRETDVSRMKMIATGMTHLYFLNKQSYLRTIVSFSGNKSVNQQSHLNDELVEVMDEKDELNYSAFRLSTTYNNKLSSRVTIKTGITASYL